MFTRWHSSRTLALLVCIALAFSLQIPVPEISRNFGGSQGPALLLASGLRDAAVQGIGRERLERQAEEVGRASSGTLPAAPVSSNASRLQAASALPADTLRDPQSPPFRVRIGRSPPDAIPSFV